MSRVARKGLYRHVIVVMAVVAGGLQATAPVLAAVARPVIAVASGQIVSQTINPNGEICQTSVVSGQATVLGAFTGVQSECVNLSNGSYAGTATFTTSTGDTLLTSYTGQTAPLVDGTVFFVETHQVTSGTGRFAAATGTLTVIGTADATGHVAIIGVGTLFF